MILLLFGLIVGIYLFHQLYWRRRKLPPGPLPLPFFGNTLTFIREGVEPSLAKWKSQYGDFHTIWLGSEPVLFLQNSATIYETFLKDGETYAGRPITEGQAFMRGGRSGIVFTDGPLWREHRRFALRVFRDFGLGKNLMQERILVEATAMISDIKSDLKNGEKILSMQDEIDRAIGSIINSLTLGYRYGRERKEEFKKVKKFATDVIHYTGNPLMRTMEADIEKYRKLPVFKQFYQKVFKDRNEWEDFFMGKIKEHQEKINFESDQEPVDYVEAYLREKYKMEKSGENSDLFSLRQLYGTLFDLWIAGQETTSNTLAWLCLYLINRPDIQQKVHKELDQVIGNDRIVTLDDKSDLNYINAVVAETQRYCNLVPINVLHRTTKDVNILGYNVPKGITITHQVSSVLQDERYFSNPKEFNPDRFLDKNGKYFSPPELMPFGIGKRACLGEGLAKMELFLFASNIFNQMRLSSPNGEKITEERIISGTTCPKPWTCSIQLKY